MDSSLEVSPIVAGPLRPPLVLRPGTAGVKKGSSSSSSSSVVGASVLALRRRALRRATPRSVLEKAFDNSLLAPFGWQLQSFLDEAFETGAAFGGGGSGASRRTHPAVAAAEQLESDVEDVRCLVAGEPLPNGSTGGGKGGGKRGRRYPPSVLRSLLCGCCEPPPPLAPVLTRPRRRAQKKAGAGDGGGGGEGGEGASAVRLRGDPGYEDGASFT